MDQARSKPRQKLIEGTVPHISLGGTTKPNSELEVMLPDMRLGPSTAPSGLWRLRRQSKRRVERLCRALYHRILMPLIP